MDNAGTVSILNVAGGDISLTFDKSNPVESIRAARVVKDMLRRGYALLIEVERDGQKAFERALDFDGEKNRYIVSDFDPIEAREAERKEDQSNGESEPIEAAPRFESVQPSTKRKGRPRKSVPAEGTRAVAVGRSAGG